MSTAAYDQKALKLAEKIDLFLHDYDPYEYMNSKTHSNSVCDQLLKDILNHDLEGLKKFLEAVLKEDNEESILLRASQLLLEIKSYDQTSAAAEY